MSLRTEAKEGEREGGCAGEKVLVLGTHGRGVNLHQHPIFFGPRRGNIRYAALTHTGDDRFCMRIQLCMHFDWEKLSHQAKEKHGFVSAKSCADMNRRMISINHGK